MTIIVPGDTGMRRAAQEKCKFITLMGVVGIALAACTPSEVILPGDREGLRAALQDAEADPVIENTSAPITLGAAQNNRDWAQPVGSPAFRTNHPALSAAPQLIWSADIGAGDARKQRITADPVVGDGRVYTLDSSARVTATTTGGATVWSRDLTPEFDREGQASGGGLTYAGGRVYVALGFGFVAALDAATGDEIWRQKLEATGSGAPTVSGDLVYLVAGDDTGWAINKDSGRIAWQIGAAQSVTNVLGAPSPAVADDLAVFAFGSGDVQAVFRRGGLRRWDSAVVGQRQGRALSTVSDITAAPLIDKGRIYVGNQSGRMVALSLGGGQRLWTAKEGAVGTIWPAGDSVFAITDLNELVRLSAEDGSRIWGVKLPKFTKERPKKRAQIFAHYGPVVAGGRVLVLSNDGQMRSFDPRDGSLLNMVAIPGGATTAPAIAGGTLYVVNTKGQLLAFR